jgi:FAD/FMN-containing dehydrogenase
MTGGPVSETAGRERAAGWRSELAGLVAGPVETATTPGYEQECDAFDRAVPQRPAIVVGAAAEPDIVAAVRFGRDHGLGVGVLATGHGLTVPIGGGLLIGTRRLGEVTVDAAARTARVAAGATWASVVTQAARSGLAPLCGSAPGVGAVSYTLGGGLGPLGRRYGFAADQVRQIDLVTADGEVRQVTPGSYPDLFWAVRGGGGNFGIATSLVVGLFPVAELYGGGLYLPGEAGADVLRAFLACAREAPDELTLSAAVMTFPPLDAVPPPLRGRFACHVRVSYCGAPAEGEALIRPLRQVAPLLLDTVRVMPFTDVGTIHNDPTTPTATMSRTLVLRAADDRMVDTLLASVGPGSPFLVEVRQMGGALGRPPPVPNAVGHRGGAFNLYATAYPNPAGLHQAGQAEQRLVDALEPWSDGGALVNFLAGPHVTPDHVRAAYAADDYQRLVRTKNSWDPGNTFRFNHNIPPGRT